MKLQHRKTKRARAYFSDIFESIKAAGFKFKCEQNSLQRKDMVKEETLWAILD